MSSGKAAIYSSIEWKPPLWGSMGVLFPTICCQWEHFTARPYVMEFAGSSWYTVVIILSSFAPGVALPTERRCRGPINRIPHDESGPANIHHLIGFPCSIRFDCHSHHYQGGLYGNC